jgi:hypothetical protein
VPTHIKTRATRCVCERDIQNVAPNKCFSKLMHNCHSGKSGQKIELFLSF